MALNDKILSLDFASLRTMQYVFELGSFSQAADKLGQTQSNVSYTVTRLRECFEDPLFVREGRKMVPTERCRAIVSETSGMLESFQGLAVGRDFDPATADALIKISCNHYERVTILPALLRMLRSQAPGISVQILNSYAQGPDQLKRGECDLLIGPVQFMGEQIYKRHVQSDEYCCIISPDSPLAGRDLTLDDLKSAPLITMRFPGNWRPLYLNRFESAGLRIKPVVELSEYGDIGGYVLNTDLLAIIPRQIASRLDSRLVLKDLPLNVPVEIDMFWTARTHLSPLHKWLRSSVIKAAQSG